tara:strand:+ start:3476 stop:4033 length:558 start_codon:yes stop_codon:yes gene_type:complete
MATKPPFPLLTINQNIQLREHHASDDQAFLDYYTHPEVVRFNIAAPVPHTLKEATEEVLYCRNLYYQRQGIYWAIANHKMIGAIGIHFRPSQVAEIHYDLSVEYWNQGIMTQAMQVAIAYCFDQLPINTLEARTLKDNTASTHILEKLGFKHHKCIENYQSYNGKTYRVEVYQLSLNNFISSHSN